MRVCWVLLYCVSKTVLAADVPGYPSGVERVNYQSPADDSQQPALFWKPADQSVPAPLLVALHTWSGGYDQQGGQTAFARWCQATGWVFVHPHFRGRNRTPEAMGSDLVVDDILGAVEFAKAQANVDPDRIYCMGGSGGGHASLLMAGRAPEVWAGVSAWCGISDIAAWHRQCRANEKFARYADEIEQALGGPPADDPRRLVEAMRRSPVNWLKNANNVALDINHGISDGRSGSVPFTHSLHAWNTVVPASKQFSQGWIAEFYASQEPEVAFNGDAPLYGSKPPIYRRTHHQTRLTIFDGGHEIIHNAGLNWLAAQRRGKPAVWEVPAVFQIDAMAKESASGK